MAKYGAKYLRWAPFASVSPDESASALPKYGTPIDLGALVKVTDSPSFNEAKQYGDNTLKEYVSEFKECPVDVELTELAQSVASAVLGAALLTTGDDTDIKFAADDTAPYGGLAFYVTKMVGNVKKYTGVYYTKVKATMQGEEYTTKGDTITLTGGKLHFVASAPAIGQWKLMSSDLADEAAAKTWVDGKIKATA
jgi:hypothetical protein